jgi:hypothetical protein
VFVTPSAATRRTGAWLEVPSDIVRAARPQCEDLPYTHAEDCVGTPHGSTTRIASGAGRYHPLYYVLVGAAALPFDGHAAVYAMRLATVLLAWLLFVLAVAATRRWARTRWPLASLVLASTPALVYSASTVAPNGVEMMAGVALWTALVGVLQDPDKRDRLLPWAVAISGSVLVTVRGLGPFWCLLVIATAMVAAWPPRDAARPLVRRRATVITAGVVLLATILGVAWTLSMHALNIGQELTEPMPIGERLHLLVSNEPLWTLQSIAAFPFRNEPTRMPVYACYVLLFAGLAYLGLAAARRIRDRRTASAIVLAIVLTSAVPFLIGLNPHAYPALWQGRYTLPYSVGIAVLIGFVLDRAGARLSSELRVAVLFLFVTAQVIGPVDVLRKNQRHRLSDYADFPHVPTAVLAVTAAVGAAAFWWGASSRDAPLAEHTRSNPAHD